MKVETEHLSLAKGALKLTIKEYSLEDVQAIMTDPEMAMAMADAAVNGWKYRDAVRMPKGATDYVFQGKTVSLYDVIKDCQREKGKRGSGPSKAAIAAGEDLAKRARIACPIEETEGDPAEARFEATEKRKAWCLAKFDAIAEVKPWIEFYWDDTATLDTNCINLQHAASRPEPKKVKTPTFA